MNSGRLGSVLPKEYSAENCSIARVMELIGERWTPLILRDAFFGIRRFADFADHLAIPRAVLTDRLRTLVQRGVLERRRYSEQPPRQEYVLTDLGVSLWPVLYQISQWGERHLNEGPPRRLFRHADCRTELDGYGFCPACAVLVPASGVEVDNGPGAADHDDRVSRAMVMPRPLLRPIQS
ncbi:winged helix-turn-helix transcriptional regulator [Streptomonospora wellingtoniae]|uniref:Helix-turn-helix domain-containing protein n=1 Tax=Streptomonospora wellingtoniae TaxID=3075544 RepID=A0ABU2KS76_9ACTN|nr:helix-turn-helix domain-containing protein [Streptomonospora sp. DSM 45055]MDT0302129.1 helix-turn-helix domain-containing protein [Streptomonospora sp. DSM 45055]